MYESLLTSTTTFVLTHDSLMSLAGGFSVWAMAILTGVFCLKRGTGGGDFHTEVATLMTRGCGNGTLLLLWFSLIKKLHISQRCAILTNTEFTPSFLLATQGPKTQRYDLELWPNAPCMWATQENRLSQAPPSVDLLFDSSDSYLAPFILPLWFTSCSSCLRTSILF